MSTKIGPSHSNPFHKLGDKLEKVAEKVGNKIVHEANEVKDAFVNGGAAAIGIAELGGLVYPVKKYRSQVSPTLTRGSRLDHAEFAQIKAQGFKGVVSLCAEKNTFTDDKYAEAAGLNHIRIPIIDNTAPTSAQMKTFLDFATNPANQPCYVHCEAGKGRTGVAVACYRMAVEGWSADRAIAEGKKFGMSLPSQQDFVRKFDRELNAGKIAGYPLVARQ